DVVAGYGDTGRPVTDAADAIGKKDVQHLGRADAVEDLGTEMRGEPLADVARQRFAGRDTHAQGDVVALRQFGRCEHRGVERRHSVEDARATVDETLEHRLWRGALG